MDDYAVLSYDRCLAEHDELLALRSENASFREENETLRAALADMAEKHLELQEALTIAKRLDGKA